MKTGLISLGCAKNLIDSELIAGMLEKHGHKVTLDCSDAPVVVINTCSFIHDAEKESVHEIVEMINAGKKIIVTGCLAQKYKDELKELLPEVTAFVGTADFKEIPSIVDHIEKNMKNKRTSPYCKVSENPAYDYPEDVERRQITMGASSYLKIADGCDCECGYCVIPKLKGKYVSRKIEDILSEAKMLADRGVSEIILIAQDTTSYGKDLYGELSLAKLLRELEKIPNLMRLRIMYTYPSGITDELLQTMAESKKIIPYIDIPLQHSSPNVLKLMRRPAFDYEKLIEKIRKTVPGVALRTTFIVGYPGETEEDFEHLKNFIQKMKFDRLGVFEYSREKGTYSDTLPGHLSYKEKRRRKSELMKIQREISKELNKELVGKNIECVVETVFDDGKIIARTYKDAPEVDCIIKLRADDELPAPGDIVVAKVTRAGVYDLSGKIVG